MKSRPANTSPSALKVRSGLPGLKPSADDGFDPIQHGIVLVDEKFHLRNVGDALPAQSGAFAGVLASGIKKNRRWTL